MDLEEANYTTSDDELGYEKDSINIENQNDIEDLTSFNQNYSKMKSEYITSPYLNKYEKTKIISERAQQLANGAKPLLKNPESYSSVYEIALQELKSKKIPFIIKRPVANRYEYWKLEDLKFL